MNLILECASEIAQTRGDLERRIILEMVDILANTNLVDGMMPEIKRRVGFADTFHDSVIVGRVVRRALKEARELASQKPLSATPEEIAVLM